jgi:hypothetical protein
MDDRGESRGYATNPKLIKGVEEIAPQKAPWAKRFPEMATLLLNRPELPMRTKFNGNLMVIQKGDAVQLKLNKRNLSNPEIFDGSGNWVTAADPGFVDAANGNLALKPDSETFRKIPGFKPIPFGEIGLFKDEWRRSLPDAKITRRPTGNPMFKKEDEKNFGT